MAMYFETEERQQELKKVLDSWVGTPYRHLSGVKGMGCDCIHFVVRVLEEIGFVPFEIPWYPRDWHMHRSDERLMDGIRKQLPHEEIGNLDDPRNGDIALFRFGRAISHAAIYFDDHIYHAVDGIGVVRTHWMEKAWHRRKNLLIRVAG
jgi:NlpC/P60 family putative phage cell wall peptidase